MQNGVTTMAKGEDRIKPIQDVEWCDKVVRVLEAFRAHNQDITANQMITLLYVFMEPGISQRTLADDDHLRLPTGTIARICAVLSDRGNRGVEGLDMIEIGHAPGDFRTSAQFLTKKGRALVNQIRDIVKGR